MLLVWFFPLLLGVFPLVYQVWSRGLRRMSKARFPKGTDPRNGRPRLNERSGGPKFSVRLDGELSVLGVCSCGSTSFCAVIPACYFLQLGTMYEYVNSAVFYMFFAFQEQSKKTVLLEPRMQVIGLVMNMVTVVHGIHIIHGVGSVVSVLEDPFPCVP